MKKITGPKHLSTLFEKYKNTLKAPEATVTNTFIEIVEEILQFTLNTKQLTFSPSTKILRVTVGGPIKTEIMLHKKELLGHLAGRLGTASAPTDIL